MLALARTLAIPRAVSCQHHFGQAPPLHRRGEVLTWRLPRGAGGEVSCGRECVISAICSQALSPVPIARPLQKMRGSAYTSGLRDARTCSYGPRPVSPRMRHDKRRLLTESFLIRYQERADSSATALSFSRRHPTSPETPQIFGLRGAACSSRIGLYPQGVSTRASVVLGISPAKAQTWLYENGVDPHHGVGAANAAIRETSAAKRSRWLLRKTTSTMSRGPMI